MNAMSRSNPRSIPWIISVDDHVIEPPHLWERGSRPSSATAAHRSSATLHDRVDPGEPDPAQGRRRPRDRLVGLRGLRLVPPDAQRLRRLRRRVVDGPDRLRPDAPGLLRPQGAGRRHGPQPRRGVAVLPHLPALLRTALRGARGQGARARLRAGVQRLDGRGVGRRLRRPARAAAASCRCGTPTLAADEIRRNAARGVHAVAFTELPGKLGLPTIHDPTATGSRSSPRATRPAPSICMHIGSGSHLAHDVTRRTAGRHRRPSCS